MNPRGATLTERTEATRRWLAANPPHPLAGLVALGTEDVPMEDRRGRLTGLRTVTRYADRRNGQIKAIDYDGEGITWLTDGPPSSKTEYAGIVVRRTSRRARLARWMR